MRTFSAAEIAKRHVETYPFEGAWRMLLGEPDIRFSSLVRGRAKSGKSTYCAKFAQHCAQWGRVLYISAEERINSRTLQNRLTSAGVTSRNVRFVHTRELEEIDRLLQRGGYRFVIVDSVQHVAMSYESFEGLRTKYKRRKLSWHLVMQMGVSIAKWEHEVDVLVEVREGWAYAHGRYGKTERMRVLDGGGPQQGGLF
jgi:adenosyl cobinamide kinase/adenosyl cobinamide phosphate guanylyltransferase